jgi:type VI secretion system ImpM family protein
MEPVPTITGFHGKLPSRGDFVGRGLPRAFTDPWTAWLNDGLRMQEGGATDAWQTAPAWNFTLPAGFVGPFAMAGLLLPSVDRVGRHYPLTIVVLFPQCAATPDPAALEDWHHAAAICAASALAEGWSPDALFDALPKEIPLAAIDGFRDNVFWISGGRQVISPDRPGAATLLAAWAGARS